MRATDSRKKSSEQLALGSGREFESTPIYHASERQNATERKSRLLPVVSSQRAAIRTHVTGEYGKISEKEASNMLPGAVLSEGSCVSLAKLP